MGKAQVVAATGEDMQLGEALADADGVDLVDAAHGLSKNAVGCSISGSTQPQVNSPNKHPAPKCRDESLANSEENLRMAPSITEGHWSKIW